MEDICETGPTVKSPYPRRLESLTICGCNCKGSTFSSVILRPWVMVWPKSNSRPPAWKPDAQTTEPPVRGLWVSPTVRCRVFVVASESSLCSAEALIGGPNGASSRPLCASRRRAYWYRAYLEIRSPWGRRRQWPRNLIWRALTDWEGGLLVSNMISTRVDALKWTRVDSLKWTLKQLHLFLEWCRRLPNTIQFPKRVPCFSFPALDVFSSRRNVRAKTLKIFNVLDIPSIDLKTRVGDTTSNKFGLCSVYV